MIKKDLRKKGFIFISLGFLLPIILVIISMIIGSLLGVPIDSPHPVIKLIDTLGTFSGLACFAIGGSFYGQSKGYSSTLGGLLGIFVVGLLILLLLKDKNKEDLA